MKFSLTQKVWRKRSSLEKSLWAISPVPWSWGTTFFINDGNGTFNIVDGKDMFPQLSINNQVINSIVNKTNTVLKETITELKKQPSINNQLINSNKLSYTFRIYNNKLLINRFDFDQVDKILTKNFHKYKVLQS